MRCREARAAIVDRSLGATQDRAVDARLTAHLKTCPGCAAEAAIEAELASDLALLREAYPHEIRITDRVMDEVRAMPPVSRAEVPDRHIAWGALAATVAAALLLGAGVRLAPELPGMLDAATTLAAGLWTALVRLAEPLLSVLAVPFTLAGKLLSSVGPPSSLLASVGPMLQSFAVIALMSMAATILFVVGRDFVRVGSREGM